MNKTLYLKLPSGQNYGWGICGYYLIKEISAKIKTTILTDNFNGHDIPGPLFQAISDINFSDINLAQGIQNYAYTFFENEPNSNTVANSKKYDLIFCGSTWCQDKLKANNINNTKVLIQGVDPEIFYPVEEKNEDRFVIFSGGKFELRKGQDLVLKAFKILKERYDNVFLINSWNNLWPETMKSMYMSKHIEFEYTGNSWLNVMNNLYRLNGIDPQDIQTYKSIPYRKQRDIYQKTDIAIFPNRCEGGTNLVMMEYMACGKPVIASYTSGHKDIINQDNSLMLNDLKSFRLNDNQDKVIADWQEPSIEELVEKLDYAYNNREKIKELGKKAGQDLKSFTWKDSADTVINSIS